MTTPSRSVVRALRRAWGGLLHPGPAALEEAVARHAGTVALGGGLAFLAFAPFDAYARRPAELVVFAADVSAGLTLLALAFAWRKAWVPRARANAFVAILGLITLASLVSSLYVGGSVGQVHPASKLNIALIVAAMGALLLSWPWFLLLMAAALVAGRILLADAPDPTLIVVFVSILFTAGLVHYARLASVGSTAIAEAALDRAQRLARIGSLERDLVTGKGHWSPMLRELFELPPGTDSLTVAQTAELVVPEDRTRILGAYASLATDGTPVDERFDVRLPSGAQRHYRFMGHRIQDPHGRPIRIEATVMDETERVVAEHDATEARAQLARKERDAVVQALAAGVAHEFNNPLMYAAGSLEMAREETQNALAKEDLPVAAREDLSRAIRDLATVANGLARIELVTKRLQRVTSTGGGSVADEDVASLVHAAVKQAMEHLPPGIAIAETIEGKGRAIVRAADVRAITEDLIQNAVDAIEHSGKGSRIDVALREEDGSLVLDVSDDGPGVPPAQHARLFTPFHTTRSTRDRIGLSLAIARNAARAMGGDLTHLPRAGGGATFRLRMALA